ncbi:hypothetical protein [Mycobacterium lepromatosis]|uniref:hypothetical protein n=1 Tax=Mycobacterium lepromatosis TaxID=480418 RepID=UPI0012E04A2A|nr:hypothetical protein [Mycobacterium lepromatosis]
MSNLHRQSTPIPQPYKSAYDEVDSSLFGAEDTLVGLADKFVSPTNCIRKAL